MKPTVFLRAGSVLTLIHAALHTAGGVFGKAPAGVAAMTYATMQTNSFSWMGEMRNYAGLLRGMGLGVAICLTVEGLVMWQLASLARTDAGRLRPITTAFALGYLALAVNSYEYFFVGAVIIEFLIAACLAGAAISAKPAGVVTANPDLVRG